MDIDERESNTDTSERELNVDINEEQRMDNIDVDDSSQKDWSRE